MTPMLQFTLIAHVLLGVTAIMFFYGVWMGLMKKTLRVGFLKGASLSGLVCFLLSWLTGGYYYVVYYGSAVKPVILEGMYPWAHAIGTEFKEHIFLFLPFLAVVSVLAFWLMGELITQDKAMKRLLVWVNGSIVVMGTVITIIGVFISGAVR